MATVTRKTQTPLASSTVIQQSTSGTKGRKHTKTTCKPRSRQSGKVPKTTTRVKRHLRKNLTGKASPKPSTSSRKLKKGKRTTLFGHYYRLKKALKHNESERHQERGEKPTTSRAYLGSQ
ncbi:unnamed protein product [Nyctereutes procyonoides]|uniref:(raccoon dog) hypothetical protein n=1 Tax=Nyctereutes procyonoides TaxID=34880 RepID=A0A811Z2G2_NYCPR|nr:unnamed protein product [Nyctereutes procyonoides]